MHRLVQNQEDYRDLMWAIEYSSDNKYIVIDTETNGLDVYHYNRVVGLALYFPALGDSFYVPVRHISNNVSPDWYNKILNKLSKTTATHIYFNSKFDLAMLQADQMGLPEQMIDVMLAAQLLNENEWLSNNGKRAGAFSLKRLAKKYLGEYAVIDENKLIEIAKSHSLNPKSELWKVPELDIVADYAMGDVEITWGLYEYYLFYLEKWNQLDLLKERSNFVMLSLLRMEQNGLYLNQDEIHQQQAAIEPRVAEIKQEFDVLAKQVGLFDEDKIINVNSNVQMLALFKLLGVKTDSLNKFVLEHVNNEWAKKLLEYRGLVKANGTYYTPYLNKVDDNGIIHPEFNAIGTVAGRITSNFHQIPQKGKHPIKKVFIPRPGGYVLIQSDYAQLELRLAVHYAQEQKMMQMFHDGTDLHQYTADQLGVTRFQGKTANFGLLYGMGASHAAQLWDMPEAQAEVIVQGWNQLYPAFRKTSRAYQRLAEQYRDANGDLGGKYQYIRLFNNRVRHFQEFAKYGYMGETRTAWNNWIQGTGWALTEASILKICRKFPDNSLLKPVLTVHDSFMYEVPADLVDVIIPKVDEIMTNWPDFDPPIKVDTKYTDKSWYEMG